jgi:3-oxoacyl-[acyl-carrier protein] reductase
VNLSLDGTRALVGGASRGLGAAIAESLHAEGTRVVIAARQSDALADTCRRCEGVAVPTDLSTEAGVSAAVAEASSALGGLDLLVVNSGGPPAGTFSDLGDDDWERAVEGTLLSGIRLVRAAIPHLRESRCASILLVLSSSVRIPINGLATSNVTRPGLAGLIKTLALELAPAIRINGLAPGRIQTERADALDLKQAEQANQTLEAVRAANAAAIPLGRYGRPEEFGAAAAFLLSPAASYVSGQILSVDGAMTRSYP